MCSVADDHVHLAGPTQDAQGHVSLVTEEGEVHGAGADAQVADGQLADGFGQVRVVETNAQAGGFNSQADLVSYPTILRLINQTTTQTGSGVRATLVTRHYATGQKISDLQMRKIACQKHPILPDWNYTPSPLESRN